MLRIGIVAGEVSGDLLAASLMRALKVRFPDVEFTGIAGPRMIAAGCKPIFAAETLSVMGLVEVLGHLQNYWPFAARYSGISFPGNRSFHRR